MRTKNTFGMAALCAFVALAGGCVTAPIYDVVNAPVVSNKAASMDDVNKAIVRAGTQLGWVITPESPGKLTGRIALRTHTAVVDITHDSRTFNIKYRDSTNLEASGDQIHKNYNGWIQNLEKGIRAQLATL
jgi:multisubunit Na+/H+ antiporter MnhE subunit